MKSQQLQLEFIENLLKVSPFNTITMCRVKLGWHRFYATLQEIMIYSGLTGALDCITFKGNDENKRLEGWRKSMINSFGIAQQEAYVQSTADFGTLCHQAIVRIKTDGKLNWEYEQDYAYEYFKQSAIENNLIPNDSIIQKQIFEYCKAAASIMAFINKEVEEIYSIEGMCKSDQYRIATPVDMVCKLVKKGIVTINLKTSSQLNDKHREQSIVERFLWNQTYNNHAQATGLLRPKDWSLKKEPTYEFELVEDKDDKILKSVLSRLAIALESENDTYLKFPKEQIIFTGETALGENPKFEVKPIEDIILESLQKTEQLT